MLRCFAKFTTLSFILGTIPNLTWASDPQDPWESYNRPVYHFNKKIDTYIFKPIAQGYRAITPQFADAGITQFFNNLQEPLVAVNNGLQGKGHQSINDLSRFVVNTVSSLGFVDVAAKIGLEKHEEDFGQTFATWGAPSGAYVVLPFLGSSTVRDALAKPFDSVVNPRNLVKDTATNVGLFALEMVDFRADIIPLEKIIEGDEYVFLRDVYLQRRNFLVHDGQVKDTFMEDDDASTESSPTTP